VGRVWIAIPVNQRWQEFMGRLFEPVPDKEEGERFAMCKEVFLLNLRVGHKRMQFSFSKRRPRPSHTYS
jgi:hypothetical protein